VNNPKGQDESRMKAYCINLDRRPDRLAHMTQQFAAAGLSFERVSAVDASNVEVAAAAQACKPGLTGLRMSAGAYGCFQSHREVWRRLIASGESHAMVFEDDLMLAPGIAAYLDSSWVPERADLVRLETALTRFHRDRGKGVLVGNSLDGRHIHRLRSRQAGTGCYIVSAGVVPRLLALSEILADPIDEWLFNEKSTLFSSLITYQMIPAPVVQGDRLESSGPAEEPGWSISSITERFAAGEARAGNHPNKAPEASIARLRRRLRESWRGLATGTAYVVAPFG
jgi:glycosyl transferase family 25